MCVRGEWGGGVERENVRRVRGNEINNGKGGLVDVFPPPAFPISSPVDLFSLRPNPKMHVHSSTAVLT